MVSLDSCKVSTTWSTDTSVRNGVSHAWARWQGTSLGSVLVSNNSLVLWASCAGTISVGETSLVSSWAWVSLAVGLLSLRFGISWARRAANLGLGGNHDLSGIAGNLVASTSVISHNVSEVAKSACTLYIKILGWFTGSGDTVVSHVGSWIWDLTGLAWVAFTVGSKVLTGSTSLRFAEFEVVSSWGGVRVTSNALTVLCNSASSSTNWAVASISLKSHVW